MLQQALYEYLNERAKLEDSTVAALLEVAAGADDRCACMVAAWINLTVEQLAQVAGHERSMPAVRRLAAERLRVHAVEAGDDVAVVLVGFDGGDGVEVEERGDLFEVRGFRFGVAWQRRLTADERRRLGKLLAELPFAEQMRCHMPAFGLRLDAGTSDETRMSVCFQCNNIYLAGGGYRTFDGTSTAARTLLQHLMDLAPTAWREDVVARSTI